MTSCCYWLLCRNHFHQLPTTCCHVLTYCHLLLSSVVAVSQAYVSAVLKAPIPAPHSTALLNTCSVAATAAALSSTGSEPAATRTHLLPVMLATYQQLAALACSAPHLQLGQVLLSSQALSTVTDILCSNYWLLPGFLAAAGVVGSSNSISAAGRVSPAVGAGGEALTSARSSYSALGNANTVSGTAGSSGNNFTGEFAVLSAVQILDSLVASTATTTAAAGSANTTATVNTTSSNKQPAGDGVSRGMHSSCSADCLCASKRSEGAEACQIGNPQCGMDGWCCCSSPKACSDITPPLTPAASSSAAGSVGVGGVVAGQQAGGGVALAGEQQLLLVLSGLLQSKLLPELLRVVQQLPLGAACIPTFSRGGSPRALDSAGGGVLGGGFGRPASTTALMVNVPPRRGSLQRDARVRVCGCLLLLSSLLSVGCCMLLLPFTFSHQHCTFSPLALTLRVAFPSFSLVCTALSFPTPHTPFNRPTRRVL